MNADEKTPCCGPSEKLHADGCPSTASSECATTPCASQGCCAPAVSSTSRWKTLLFLLVMGAAVAVLGHGLVKRSGETTDAGRPPFFTGAPAKDPANTAPAVCGLTLDSLASLNSMAADKEAVFILLPGEDRESVEAASRKVEAAVIKIRSKGKRVAAFTLEKIATDHARLDEQLSITSFPCVVALGRGCGSSVVTGEMTEAKLLQAFVAASAPSSSCGTTSCDPSGCK